MQGLCFERDGDRVELPAMGGGLPEGLTVQVWVQRLAQASGQRVLELGDAEGRRIFLATHGESGICFGVDAEGATRTIATNALPDAAWLLVRATLTSRGEATLAIHGIVAARGTLMPPTDRPLTVNLVGRGASGGNFIGRLAQLQIWRRADAPVLATPVGTEKRLWAYYPLDAVDGDVLRDKADGNRHARASGPLRVDGGAAPLADGAVALRLAGGSVDAAPLRGPLGGLTVQMWIRPERVDVEQPLFEAVDEQTGARVTLSCGSAGGVGVAVVIGGATVLAASRAQIMVAGSWTHVALHLDAAGGATLLVDDRAVAEAKRPEQAATLAQLLQADVLERVTLGSSVAGPTTFVGMLAEVRVFRGARAVGDPAISWLRRVRGDEAGLMIAYTMDAAVAGAVLDRSPTCSHGQISGSAGVQTAPGLPLHDPADTGLAHVRVRGALVREHLPLALFPADAVWSPAAAQAADRRAANAAAFGTVEGDRVLCSVYEAYLEPRHDVDTAAVGETLEVCADASVRVLVDDAEETTAATWSAGQVVRLAVPASGRARVRVLAGDSLQCPGLRVRWSAMPGDLWTVVRPAEALYAGLSALDAGDLRAPADGRSSPLPADATAEDAEALVEALSALGAALPVAPQEEPAPQEEVDFGIGKPFKKAGKSVEKAGKDAVNKGDDARKKAEEEARRAEEAARKQAEEEARRAEEAARKAKAAEEAAKKAAEEATRQAKAAEEAAKKAAEEAAKKAAEEAARQAAEAAEEAAKKAAEEAARQAKAAEEAAKTAAEEAARQAKAAEEAAKTAARKASNFVVRGLDEAQALLDKAAKLRPETGVAAIKAGIAGAKRLLVVPPELARGLRTVQLIGTRLVDGVESTFRIIVAGIEDAVAATAALVERIGATIERFIDYLASLFAWGKFLAMSDRIYDAALRCYDKMAPELARVAELPDTLEAWIRRPVAPELADKTIGDVLGIKLGRAPGFAELDDFMDKVQRLFSSRNRRTEGEEDRAAQQAVDGDADDSPQQRGGAALLPAKGNLLRYPIGPLLTTPAALWDASAPMIRTTCQAIAAAATATAKQGRSLLTGRIKVPWLTDVIETTILGGRKLDLLRVIALVAAIPAVLVETIADEFVSFGGDVDEDDIKAMRWLSFGCSMTNTLVTILRIAAEKANSTDLEVFAFAMQGVTSLIQAGANFALVSQIEGEASQLFAGVATSLDVAMGGWYFYMSYRLFLMSTMFIGSKAERERVDRLDAIVEVGLGSAQIVLIIVGLSLDGEVDDRLAATLAFRSGNMFFRALERICAGLDKPTSPRRELASLGRMGSNGMMFLIDLADGAYTASEA